MPNIFRQKHPYLPLIVTRSADRQVAGHVVRIEYDPAKSDRNVVPSIKLSTPYKKLAYFVDLLQEKILDRVGIVNQSLKDWLSDKLFEWIHKQVLGEKSPNPEGRPKIYPMVGLVKVPGWEFFVNGELNINVPSWDTILAGNKYTETQEELAKYFSGQSTPELAADTACKVVQNFLAEHTGERTVISFKILIKFNRVVK
jgi:hypothetical protein